MDIEEFVTEVQNNGLFQSREQAMTAIRATLVTFSTRLTPGEALELAAWLPETVGKYLFSCLNAPVPGHSMADFFNRIALLEGVEVDMAAFHARAVMRVVQKAFAGDAWFDTNPWPTEVWPFPEFGRPVMPI